MLPRVSMRRRVWGAAFLWVLLAGSDFRGCGSEEGPPRAPLDDGVPLPAGDGRCVVDANCMSDDECVGMACVGGACVATDVPTVDEDGDGYAPFPCGMDCRDDNGSVFPGATEICNGLDDDCDGIVDEDAPGAHAEAVTSGLWRATIVGLSADFAVVGVNGSGLPAARVLPVDAPSSRMDVAFDSDSPPSDGRFAAATVGDTVIVAATGPSDEPPRRYELELVDGDLVASAGPTPIGDRVGAGSIDIALLGGQEWIVFDTATERLLWRSGAPAELVTLSRGAEAPVLASDGTRMAVTDGDRDIRFFDTDGSDAGTQTLPGDFAHRALAPGSGLVYAAYRDAFDHVLTRVTTTAFTSPTTAPGGASGGMSDDVSLFWAPPHVLVTRRGASSVGAWLMDDALRRVAASFGRADVTVETSLAERLSASTNGAGLSAIYTTHGDMAFPSLSLLECR